MKNIKIILMESDSMLFCRLVALFWRNWLPPTEEYPEDGNLYLMLCA